MSKDMKSEIRAAAKRMPVNDREVAINISRTITGIDRPSERVMKQIQKTGTSGIDANGAQHLNLTRSQLDLLTRADAAAMTQGNGGTQVSAIGQVKAGERIQEFGRFGVAASYCNVIDLKGTPFFITYESPAADLSLGEMTDGDLGVLTATRNEFVPQRAFIGTSWSGQMQNASGLDSASIMSALRNGLNKGIDAMVFDSAVADLAGDKYDLGTTEALWITGLLEGVYNHGFVNPLIVGSSATLSKLAGSSTIERPNFGEIAGIPMLASSAGAGSADQLVVVEAGDSGLTFGEFDLSLIVDKYTLAQTGRTQAQLQSMFDVVVTDSAKVARFDLTA